ncbi:hypothetical protein [Intrasporangium calvum]|uniref:Uncharacterized protein n=1 Tax=Intrasporangium calvum (strain ATCC 23552 / DSM 43043 / JCM 3097 / NBRC 12989 / NCIMB 10167 / NRRL B-3866 / 7 KIP) TaxID=710696 RepID=E6SDC1_INTC7|nr:hypothetical protein [Intrasporangium calvum]ADU47543.1 hypothetical protein Intca_1020 [Intrasporangium calvum DSM 43043]
MTGPVPLSDLVADDLLLDRLAGRLPAGPEPVEQMLARLAAHADHPLVGRPTVRRSGRRRALSALSALALGASGAGVAAAVSVSDGRPAARPAVVAPRPAAQQPETQRPGPALVREATDGLAPQEWQGWSASTGARFDTTGLAPVLLPAPVRLSSGSEVNRTRWSGLTVSREIVSVGLEGLGRPHPPARPPTTDLLPGDVAASSTPSRRGDPPTRQGRPPQAATRPTTQEETRAAPRAVTLRVPGAGGRKAARVAKPADEVRAEGTSHGRSRSAPVGRTSEPAPPTPHRAVGPGEPHPVIVEHGQPAGAVNPGPPAGPVDPVAESGPVDPVAESGPVDPVAELPVDTAPEPSATPVGEPSATPVGEPSEPAGPPSTEGATPSGAVGEPPGSSEASSAAAAPISSGSETAAPQP